MMHTTAGPRKAATTPSPRATRPRGRVDAYLAERAHTVKQWVMRATVLAATLSILAHVAFGIITALITLDQPPAGIPTDEEHGVSVVAQTELTSLSNDAAASQPLSSGAAPETSVAAVPDPPADLDLGVEPGTEGGPTLSGAGSGKGGDGGTGGDGLELTGGAGGSASFFGVEARGARFVFIVDTSGSMAGAKIDALRRELTRSIDALSDEARFAVYFFASETRTLGGSDRWIDSKDRNRRWAAAEIRAVQPQGGTNPMPAFIKALSMRPRPDAVYFMTDGVFDAGAAHAIAELNSRARKSPIHCISFVSAEARSTLQTIAAESGGTYTHVPGPAGAAP